MDRVRLGRALGRGARMAAQTAYEAIDAATAPKPTAAAPNLPANPRPSSSQPVAAQSSAATGTMNRQRRVRQTSAPIAVQNALGAGARVRRSTNAAREGVLSPVKRASRAVSLEIAGSFFGLFAASFAAAAWRFRNPSAADAKERLWMYLGLAAVFGYFSISSFLRARKVSRTST